MDASPAEWIGRLERDDAPPGPAVPESVLVAYPVTLGLRYRQHLAEVFRELQMVAASDDATDGPPARLVALARDATARFGDSLAGPHVDAERAAARGDAHVDLRYPLDPDIRPLLIHFARVMEEVDAFSRSEDLVTLQAAGDLYALRRWAVEESVRQYDGLPPRPWPQWWGEHRDEYAEGAGAREAGRGDPEGPGAPAGTPR